MTDPSYLTADEAADRLDITKNTLYAYVSRGLIRSEPGPGRTRKYDESDILRLARGSSRSTTSGPSGRRTRSGAFTTRVVNIDNGRLYYRGRDACRLARSEDIASVMHLFWGTGDDASIPGLRTSTARSTGGGISPDVFLMAPLLSGLSPLARMQSLLAIVQDEDPRAFDLSPDGSVRSGQRVVSTLAAAATGSDAVPRARTPEAILCSRWDLDEAGALALIRAALIVSMGHPPGSVALAARSAAAAGASPYGAVLAALAALGGRHAAGEVRRVHALFSEAGTPDRLPHTIADRQHRGDDVPGFGHPLYPNGDPRARVLHRLLRSQSPDTEGAAFTVAADRAGPDRLGQAPSLVLALVALARALNLPDVAPSVILAVARSVHWVAQAMEEYAGDPLRVDAAYAGPPPDTETDDGPMS
jgi:citrate synthase